MISCNKTITNSLHLRQTFVHYTLIIFVDKTRVQKKKKKKAQRLHDGSHVLLTFQSFRFAHQAQITSLGNVKIRLKLQKSSSLQPRKKNVSRRKKIQSSLLNATEVASTLP